MMNLNRDPSELIKPEWFEEYKKEIEVLWKEICELNTDLFILEKISVFPFKLFVSRGDYVFWNRISWALYESYIMSVWRIVIDSESGVLTIRKFKNTLFQNLRNDQIRGEMREALRFLKFEDTVSRVKKEIRDLRNNFIGHFNREVYIEDKEIYLPSLSELQEIRDVLNKLINLLGFNIHYKFLPPEYDPEVQYPKHMDSRPDIEKILDSLARDSYVLNEPEREPTIWPHIRQSFEKEDMEMINKYRVKFGLPPA